jgi:hypothetical protein
MTPYLNLFKCAKCGYVSTVLAMVPGNPITDPTGPNLYSGATFADIGTPVEVRDTTKEAAEALRKLKEDAAKCDDDYPHKCPFCGNAAYVGATKIDCKARCEDSK